MSVEMRSRIQDKGVKYRKRKAINKVAFLFTFTFTFPLHPSPWTAIHFPPVYAYRPYHPPICNQRMTGRMRGRALSGGDPGKLSRQMQLTLATHVQPPLRRQ